jgi:hypothetical protein
MPDSELDLSWLADAPAFIDSRQVPTWLKLVRTGMAVDAVEGLALQPYLVRKSAYDERRSRGSAGLDARAA